MSQLILKRSYSRILEKLDLDLKTQINLSTWLCRQIFEYITQKFIGNKAIIYASELILNPFSPFDSKCKKISLMQKTSWNVFLGHLGGWAFHIFPRLHSVMKATLMAFRTFVDHTIFNWSPVQHLIWSYLWRKKR